jgi:hypothetical protein
MPSPSDTSLAVGQVRLALMAGQFRYDMLQNTTVQIEGGADTLQSFITTTGVLLVEVMDHSDSTYTITVSADSLRLDTRGAGSLPGQTGPLQVGPVLRASFTRFAVSVENQLADSLCAYGQLLSTARELLLPQLPIDGAFPVRANARDTATTTTCRAGSRITSQTTRDLADLQRQPQEFAVRGQTELAGRGVLRNDSIAVSGLLRSQGTVFFREGLRLPRRVETQSTGRIQVQLGDSTTVFRQTTTQTLELRPPSSQAPSGPPPPPNELMHSG